MAVSIEGLTRAARNSRTDERASGTLASVNSKLPRLLITSGKSALLLAGIGFGVAKTAEILFRSGLTSPCSKAPNGEMETIHRHLGRLESRLETLESTMSIAVDKKQLDAAISQAFRPLSDEVDRRFSQQARATDALRSMIAKTDELLGRVLVQLEGFEQQGSGQNSDVERHAA